MPLISKIYFIIFLPLISSLVCQIFNKVKIHSYLTATCLLAVIAIAINIAPEVFSTQNIVNNFSLQPLSIGLEFRLDGLAIIFLVAIIFLKFITLFYHKNDAENFLSQKNHKTFYAAYLVQIFAIIGAITTNNLLNLFLFLEIYSCSFLAIFSISKDTKIAQLSLRYFFYNSAASLLILFSFIIIYINFHSLNLDEIKQLLIASHDVRFFTILAVLTAIGFAIKFFSPNLYFKTLKNNNNLADFFASEALFIHSNLGIFFAIKFSYLFFIDENIKILLIFALIVLIIYSLVSLHYTKHLKLAATYLGIINLCLIFICLMLQKTNAQTSLIDLTNSSSQLNLQRSTLFYWLNFNLINFAIYLFATLLKHQFGSSSYQQITALPTFKIKALQLRLLIIFCASLPFTFLFYGNWYLALETLKNCKIFTNSAVLGIVAIITILFFTLSLKILSAIFFAKNNETVYSAEPRQYLMQSSLLWLVIIIAYSAILCFDFLNKLSLQFIIT